MHMKILAIETSCDETAISLVECKGDIATPQFQTLSEVVLSQLALHAHWGGVVPTIAKREHEKALVPVLKETLEKAGFLTKGNPLPDSKGYPWLSEILEREKEMIEPLQDFLVTNHIPEIDAVAVTQGPGLEPALWVGINFAKALARAWQKPLIPVNHMEGHLVSPILNLDLDAEHPSEPLGCSASKLPFPAIALLVSGGHTELILVKSWGNYLKIGETRDDAAGEAFDKVARLLGLGYPGGPAISQLAERYTVGSNKLKPLAGSRFNLEGSTSISLPRPMLNSGDFDFSFSGLKTAVRYMVERLQKDDPLILELQEIRAAIAHEFQEAVVEVLVTKTERAVDEYGAKSVIVGGGVSANKRLRGMFEDRLRTLMVEAGLHVLFPTPFLSTDNATMIAAAAYINILVNKQIPDKIVAIGNLSL